MNIEFFIPGIPAPGGSKRAFVLKRKDGSIVRRPNGSPMVNITDDAGQRNKDWRANVALCARQAMQGQPPTDKPLIVSITFYRTRPKGHHRSNGALRDTAPAFPTSKPDVLKLMRSTEDAMTGIVWVDDAQVVSEHLHKRFSSTPGAKVQIRLAESAMERFVADDSTLFANAA